MMVGNGSSQRSASVMLAAPLLPLSSLLKWVLKCNLPYCCFALWEAKGVESFQRTVLALCYHFLWFPLQVGKKWSFRTHRSPFWWVGHLEPHNIATNEALLSHAQVSSKLRGFATVWHHCHYSLLPLVCHINAQCWQEAHVIFSELPR